MGNPTYFTYLLLIVIIGVGVYIKEPANFDSITPFVKRNLFRLVGMLLFMIVLGTVIHNTERTNDRISSNSVRMIETEATIIDKQIIYIYNGAQDAYYTVTLKFETADGDDVEQHVQTTYVKEADYPSIYFDQVVPILFDPINKNRVYILSFGTHQENTSDMTLIHWLGSALCSLFVVSIARSEYQMLRRQSWQNAIRASAISPNPHGVDDDPYGQVTVGDKTVVVSPSSASERQLNQLVQIFSGEPRYRTPQLTRKLFPVLFILIITVLIGILIAADSWVIQETWHEFERYQKGEIETYIGVIFGVVAVGFVTLILSGLLWFAIPESNLWLRRRWEMWNEKQDRLRQSYKAANAIPFESLMMSTDGEISSGRDTSDEEETDI